MIIVADSFNLIELMEDASEQGARLYPTYGLLGISTRTYQR